MITSSSIESTLAGRAIGAMFFSIFGGAWLGLWSYQVFDGKPAFLWAIAAATAVLAGFAYGRWRRYRHARAAAADSPLRRKASRMFNIVNAVQWAAILMAGQALPYFGLSRWLFPTVIFIVGLHFLPLAHSFRSRAHYVTGTALVLLAAIYPWLAPAGPSDPAGCLGAGLILWSSALWALAAAPVPRPANI